MRKLALALISLLMLTGSLFAQNAKYAELYAKAKEYEAQGKYFYALASYYEAMEAEPSEKAEEALDAYKKLADVLKAGKPGYGEDMDEFDIYDGWLSIAGEYDSYWKENCPVYFKSCSFEKGELNMETRTGSYSASATDGYTSKYLELKDIVYTGWKNAYRNDWSKGKSSSLPLEDDPEKRTYYVAAEAVDSNGTVLFNLPETKKTGSYYYDDYSYKWTVKDVSRDDMKKIDAQTVTIRVTGVKWKDSDSETRAIESPSMEQKNNAVSVVDTAVTKEKERIAREKEEKERKEKYAQTLKNLVNSFVYVEGGTFQMGSNYGTDGEKPVHNVTLSSFYMSKTEITQLQWIVVMKKNSSYYDGDNYPVKQVSWYDAIVFCNRFSILENKTPVYSVNGETDPDTWGYTPCMGGSISGNITMNIKATGYRLPTEAEWEYAAKGGNKSKGFIYSGSDILNEVAWYNSNSKSEIHDVATKTPNELGLYDMSGNVMEWCWDWYGSYSSGSQTNPRGSSSGVFRVLRGGGWRYDLSRCRSGRRASYGPDGRSDCGGFRLVRNAE